MWESAMTNQRAAHATIATVSAAQSPDRTAVMSTTGVLKLAMGGLLGGGLGGGGPFGSGFETIGVGHGASLIRNPRVVTLNRSRNTSFFPVLDALNAPALE